MVCAYLGLHLPRCRSLVDPRLSPATAPRLSFLPFVERTSVRCQAKSSGLKSVLRADRIDFDLQQRRSFGAESAQPDIVWLVLLHPLASLVEVQVSRFAIVQVLVRHGQEKQVGTLAS
jgi:hypothetical protein